MVKVLAGGLTSQVFVVLSNSSCLDKTIRTQLENRFFPLIPTKLDGEKFCRSKHYKSPAHSPWMGGVCRTLSFNSFSVWRNQVLVATRGCSLKPMRWWQTIHDLFFRYSRIEWTFFSKTNPFPSLTVDRAVRGSITNASASTAVCYVRGPLMGAMCYLCGGVKWCLMEACYTSWRR